MEDIPEVVREVMEFVLIDSVDDAILHAMVKKPKANKDHKENKEHKDPKDNKDHKEIKLGKDKN